MQIHFQCNKACYVLMDISDVSTVTPPLQTIQRILYHVQLCSRQVLQLCKICHRLVNQKRDALFIK